MLCAAFAVSLRTVSSVSETDLYDQDETVVYRSPVHGPHEEAAVVTIKQIDHFIERYRLRPDAKLEFQYVTTSVDDGDPASATDPDKQNRGSFTFGGRSHALPSLDVDGREHEHDDDGNEWRRIVTRTADATFARDGERLTEAPVASCVHQKTTDSGDVLTLSMSCTERDRVESVVVTQKDGGIAAELAPIVSRVLVTMLPHHFLATSHDHDHDHDHNHDHHHRRRRLGSSSPLFSRGACSTPRVVEIAVAFDRTYCAHHGSYEAALSSVDALVAAVSALYRTDCLCLSVRSSYVEGFCDEDDGGPPAVEDPYADMVALDRKGCGNDGTLDAFQDLWVGARGGVRRDVAHLFSGTCLESSSSGSCATPYGCTFEKSACDRNRAYGVSYVTFSDSVAARSVRLAHELGHTLGAGHDAASGTVMSDDHSLAGGGVFSDASKQQIRTYVEGTATCVECDDVRVDGRVELVAKRVLEAFETLVVPREGREGS